MPSPKSERVYVDVAASLVARARAAGARSIAVVGASKNAGKTVTVGALAEALERAGEPFGICSIGRDGEAIDAANGAPKPRIALPPGTLVATATHLIPRTPALEITELTGERSAVGRIAIGRVRAPGRFEIAGPPSAAAVRRIVNALGADGRLVLVDGAIDRLAALRGGDDAIVVAIGAAGARTIAAAAADAAGLVGRLQLRRPDPARESITVAGALTASVAATFAAAGERRQLIVPDPTYVTLRGTTFVQFARVLDLRSECPFHVLACTVAPASTLRAFDPRAFAHAIATSTGLPAYDVYAGTVAAGRAA